MSAACGFAHQYKSLDAEDLPLVLANYLARARACCSIPATRTTSRPSAPHHPDHRRQLPTDRATHDQVARVMEIKQLDTLDPDVIHAARQMLVVGIH